MGSVCGSLFGKKTTNLIEDFHVRITTPNRSNGCFGRRVNMQLPLEKTPGIYDRTFIQTIVAPCCTRLNLEISTIPKTKVPLKGFLIITVHQDYCNNSVSCNHKPCRTYVQGSRQNRPLVSNFVPYVIRHKIRREDFRSTALLFDSCFYSSETACLSCPIFLTLRGRIHGVKLNAILALRLARSHKIYADDA
jgi:hypothetical protein